MNLIYCPKCLKRTPHKTALDLRTPFASIKIISIWLAGVGPYPKRCTACGTENIDPADIRLS